VNIMAARHMTGTRIVCVCLYIHLYVCICMYVYMYVCRYVCMYEVDLGGLVVSVLATGPKVRGFDPNQCRWTLRVIKILRRESKAVGPMS
jgi:hypothetical protein